MAASTRLARKVLLIGWDAADWKIIKPLLDAGRLPTLERMIGNGVMGNLASVQPMLSPMLWTSIATGKRADKHGICGFLEPDPSGTGVRPATSTSRKCKAVWNILMQQGFRCHVVGWFSSHPAEPIDGVYVSEQFGKPVGGPDDPWPLAAGTVHPDRLSSVLADLRVHPADFGLEDFFPFIPQAASIDQQKHHQLAALAGILAECGSIQAAATWALANEPWDFAAVYFNAIDHFCHRFMAYHPPRLEHVPAEEFELYKNVVYSAYCFHDLLLARLLELAGDDTAVLLVSDHGYHSDHLRPLVTPAEPTGPEVWHRPYGICVMQGPHVRRDELLFGATLLDVTPTVLTLFGLPIGEDMDGKPWLQAFDQPLTPEWIPSWEEVAGECGMHPPGHRTDPADARAMLRQLLDLGYVESSEDAADAAEKAIQEGKYNLARTLLHAGRIADALPLLEEVHALQPARLNVALNLATGYHAAGRLADCRRMVDYIAAGNCSQRTMEGAAARIVPQVDLLRGLLEFADGRSEQALAHLHKAAEDQPRMRGLHLEIGHVHLAMSNWKGAAAAFEKELEIDSESPNAHDGLALALLNLGRNQEAADHALHAVGLLHHLPRAHYHLGVALARLGKREQALHALQTCSSMSPKFAEQARALLAALRSAVPAQPTAPSR